MISGGFFYLCRMKAHPLNFIYNDPIYYCDKCDQVAKNRYELNREDGYLCDIHFAEHIVQCENEIRQLIGSGFSERKEGLKKTTIFESRLLVIYYRPMFVHWSIKQKGSDAPYDLYVINFPITEEIEMKVKTIIQKYV